MKNVLKNTSIIVLRQQTLSGWNHWYSAWRDERSTSNCKFRTVPLEPKLLRILIHSHHAKDKHKIFPDEMSARYVTQRHNRRANIWKRSFETTDATFPKARPCSAQVSHPPIMWMFHIKPSSSATGANSAYQDAETPNSYFKHQPLTNQCV